MKNKHFIFLLIGIIGVIGITLFLSLLLWEGPENNTIGTNNSSIIMKSEMKVENVQYISSIYSSTRIANPSFTLGAKYTYQIWQRSNPSSVLTDPNTSVIPQPSEYQVDIYVDRIERIDKTNYFHVSAISKNASKIYLLYREGKYEYLTVPIKVDGDLYYVEAINGSILPVRKNNSICWACNFFYSPWMLYLNNDIRWKEMLRSNYKGEEVKLILEYNVEGIEKVNGRKCFKVRMEGKNPVIRTTTIEDVKTEDVKTSYILIKNIFWVDIEKRFLIKSESYENNLLTLKMELKDENNI